MNFDVLKSIVMKRHKMSSYMVMNGQDLLFVNGQKKIMNYIE